jgi:hypothetical protein
LLDHGFFTLSVITIAILFVVVLPLALLVIGLATIEDWSARALVTDRRLLYRARWNPPALTSIPFAEIAALEVSAEGALRIEREGRADFAFADPRRAQDLAVAIAEAAGLPRPAVYGPLANMHWFVGLCGLAIAVALSSLVPDGPVGALRGDGAWLGWTLTIGLSLLGAAALLAALPPCFLLGVWIGLALLRPFTGRDKVRAWLAPGDESTPRPQDTVAGWIWDTAWATTRGWAGLLYGKAVNEANHGAESHG